jgi:large subunit ribosomal protein L16
MIIRWKPKREKFKRLHKGVISKCQFRKSAVRAQQGNLSLRALKSGIITAKQLEQARRKIIRFKKKKHKQKIWYHCIPDIPITKKPLGLRMGKGKGSPKSWISRVVAGKSIIHLNYMQNNKPLTALILVRKILPIPTRIVSNIAINRYIKHVL